MRRAIASTFSGFSAISGSESGESEAMVGTSTAIAICECGHASHPVTVADKTHHQQPDLCGKSLELGEEACKLGGQDAVCDELASGIDRKPPAPPGWPAAASNIHGISSHAASETICSAVRRQVATRWR